MTAASPTLDGVVSHISNIIETAVILITIKIILQTAEKTAKVSNALVRFLLTKISHLCFVCHFLLHYYVLLFSTAIYESDSFHTIQYH